MNFQHRQQQQGRGQGQPGRPMQPARIGAKRDENGAIINYDEHGQRIIGFDPAGRTIVGYYQDGSPTYGGRNVGATPPAHPERNIGAINAPDVFKTPPPQGPGTNTANQANPVNSSNPAGAPAQPGGRVPYVDDPTKSMAERMSAFNNRDRSTERAGLTTANYGSGPSSGAGLQEMRPGGAAMPSTSTPSATPASSGYNTGAAAGAKPFGLNTGVATTPQTGAGFMQKGLGIDTGVDRPATSTPGLTSQPSDPAGTGTGAQATSTGQPKPHGEEDDEDGASGNLAAPQKAQAGGWQGGGSGSAGGDASPGYYVA